ncbi:MAG: hypothetical protein LCI00_10305 [Chloroflexi bacterium]|nr:hypothetical protein [Chloroflexota bacterium]MCC6894846.1 hypothetical protein [Anaerolineae bacterium]
MKRIPYLAALFAAASLFTASLSVHAQDAVPAGAAVQDDRVVITGGGSLLPVNNPPNGSGFYNLAWNPGGTKLAYIFSDTEFVSHIAVTDASATDPIVLDTGALEAGFPVSWTPDGQILYVGSGDFTDTSKPYTSELKRIAPEAGAVPEVIGSFEMGTGCGGGSPFPSDWVYWEEAGFGGNALVLRWTDYGILHSSNCGGSSLKLFAPQGGEDTPLVGDNYLEPVEGEPQFAVGRAVLSGDGKTLVAVRSTYNADGPVTSLVLIDLSTRELTDVTTTAQPEQVAWLADGSVLYSTRTTTGSLNAGLTDEQKTNFESIFGTSEFDVPAYEVAIHHLNPATGEDSQLYTAPASVIGRMQIAPDGQSLLFSQIANLDQWVLGIADGTLDIMADNDGSAQRALVPVTLYRLPFAGGEATVIAENLAQFRLKP